MTKSETLYRAGYMSAAKVDTLSMDRKQLPGESWNERNDRLDKIAYASSYGWRLVSYAIKARNTTSNQAVYDRGFMDRMQGTGYSFDK